MRHRIANITNPSTTSISCVGTTDSTVVGATFGGIGTWKFWNIEIAVDGGAPSGNATASGPVYDLAVVVADRPAARAPNRIAGGDRDARDVGEAHERAASCIDREEAERPPTR